jgi:hypothetical protein
MLNTWEAKRLVQVITFGRTRPMVIECTRSTELSDESTEETSNDSVESQRLVVKANGLPEITDAHLFCEAFGNLLARELHVDTPQPALVNLSEEFVYATNLSLKEHEISLHEGLAVGCEYFHGGFTSVIPGMPLMPEETAQAAQIYGFDLLVQNPDRRPDKPNCAHLGNRLIAYDFELCFSFIYLIGMQNPWAVSQHGLGTRHLFNSILRNRPHSWKKLINALNDLSDERLNSLSVALPNNWKVWLPKVQSHLQAVKTNLPEFEHELQRSLS